MRACWGAALAAALLALVARVEAPWHLLAPVALAPWLVGLEGARPRAALGSAALLAAAMTAFALPWLPAAAAAYARAPAPVAWLATVALSPLLVQPQFLAAAAARLLSRRLRMPRAAVAAATALAYVGAEWALPKLFDDTLGVALHPSPALRQLAELGGVRGLTLLCLATSECAAAAFALRRLAPAAAGALALGGAALAGQLRLASVEAQLRAAPTFPAGLVQAAIGAYDKLAAEEGTYEAVRRILDAHFALSAELLQRGPLDLLVWPETVYPTTFGAPKSSDGAAFDAAIARLPSETSVPLVFGAFQGDAAGEHNAAFFLDRRGVAAYQKALLFPLTERVPAWLEAPWLRAALPWAGRWEPGPGPRAVDVQLRDGSAVRFAPLICYEAVHAGYAAAAARLGADALLTLSNDAWFPGPEAPRLHLLAAAFRSVELRLPQLRATNSGMSALILPTGELVSATAFGARAAVRVEVPRVGHPWTPVRAFGDWLGPAALAALALLLGGAAARPGQRIS